MFRDYGLFSVKNDKNLCEITFFSVPNLAVRIFLMDNSPQNSGATFASSPFFDWGKPAVLYSGALIEVFSRFHPEKSSSKNCCFHANIESAASSHLLLLSTTYTAPAQSISRPSWRLALFVLVKASLDEVVKSEQQTPNRHRIANCGI